MYKYIITWVVSTVVSMECPDANRLDEFGSGGSSYTTSCMVYHCKTITETKSKTFKDKDSAFAFYNRGKNKTVHDLFGITGGITEMKIDSLYHKN